MGSFQEIQPDYDVLVIGAGLSGCYASHKMKELEMSVKVLEAGSSVGGTWYWSRSARIFRPLRTLIPILHRSLSWLSLRLRVLLLRILLLEGLT